MKDNNGFTLLELMIVVALIAIIATLATPSMRNFIQRGQVAAQMKEFAHFLQESRGKAVLLRASRYTATIESASLDGKPATIGDTNSSWTPNAKYVNFNSDPATGNKITYTLMGNVDAEVCYIITHANNPTIGEVLVLDRNGSIKIHKNKTDCTFT